MSGLPVRPVARAFFARPVVQVARDLLGCLLVHETPDGRVAGSIVETEAYAQDDPGSHAFRGKTMRNGPMWERPGTVYVYFTYGMHWCLNVSAEADGVGAAILLRAVEPVEGIELMRERRGPTIRDRDIARGPGRLTQAFGVGPDHNRHDMTTPPLMICAGERLPYRSIVETERIGLGAAQDGRRWRFAVRSSPWTSGPRALG